MWEWLWSWGHWTKCETVLYRGDESVVLSRWFRDWEREEQREYLQWLDGIVKKLKDDGYYVHRPFYLM